VFQFRPRNELQNTNRGIITEVKMSEACSTNRSDDFCGLFNDAFSIKTTKLRMVGSRLNN
jgi:hypothetical protein